MELFETVAAYFMVTYLFMQLLRFRCKSIKPLEKLSRRHFMNSFDASEVLA